MTLGPVPTRTWEASSAKVVSRTWCRPFSIDQCPRNLAIGILWARGDHNIAAALGRNARDATRLLALLGVTSP
jgi:hypothetical protein